MPKPKNSARSGKDKNNHQDDEIKIKVSDSSLAEFTKRSLPSEEQVEKFEEFIEEEVKEEGIEESLNEIYQDGKGEIVDVKRLDIKKRHGFFFWFFAPILIIGSLGIAGYAAYNYYLHSGSNATTVEFSIEGKSEVNVGEEFFYTIDYKNLSNVNINNARITVKYPDNFIFLDSIPESIDENSIWEFAVIPAHRSGKIKIKGMMIGAADETGFTLASFIYTPENFSSEFKKESYLTTVIQDIGLDFDFDYIASALVGEENEILIRYRSKENNFINNFRLTFEPQENIQIINIESEEKIKDQATFSTVRPGVWQIDEVLDEERVIPIKFIFDEKINDSQDVVLHFEQISGGDTSTSSAPGRYYKFLEKTLNFEVMKSDLNLTLIINGSRNDQGIDFGQTLNYSIVYKNRGETEMKDVVIMTVLESDFLDWTTLEDSQRGKEKGNTISWSKEELAGLEVLGKNEEGTIDFAIKVMEFSEVDLTKDYQVKSFAQFSIGNIEEMAEDSDNRSNAIINKINSDLRLAEEVRYFSDDNIPVGTGPHPPKVGEKTSYKVYWDLSNSLNELNDLKITVKLPEYVEWSGKEQATVGTIRFNKEPRVVVWDIGRLPITVYQAMAEFSISIMPIEEDKNKIMVLLPGAVVQAVDSVTETTMGQTTKAKTTKLEDDEIATGDGRVE